MCLFRGRSLQLNDGSQDTGHFEYSRRLTKNGTGCQRGQECRGNNGGPIVPVEPAQVDEVSSVQP